MALPSKDIVPYPRDLIRPIYRGLDFPPPVLLLMCFLFVVAELLFWLGTVLPKATKMDRSW
jgi:uncharacterized membrane protein YvlD (DUF360 family)